MIKAVELQKLADPNDPKGIYQSMRGPRIKKKNLYT